MEFGNIAYVFEPLSQWVRLSYFSSKIQTYIRKVSNGLKNSLNVLWYTSITQHNWRHWKRMNESRINGLQIFSPQWLPCIKMALALQFFNISPLMNPPRMLRTYGLYRLEVGNKLPTSPQDMASKRAPYSSKNGQNLPKLAEKSLKIIIINF